MKNNKISFVIGLIIMISVLCCACNNNSDKQTFPPAEEYSNEVQVIVLLGQSNAEGHTHSRYLTKTVGAEKAALYASGFDNVNICYANTIDENTSNGEFLPVKTGQGHSAGQFGPEVGMAEVISNAAPRKKVCIIKYAYGATSLSNQWRSPSSGATGYLYTNAVEYIIGQCKKLEDIELYPVIKAVCWMQGENDAGGQDYASYKMLEGNFVKDLRKALEYYKPTESEIGFVDAAISDCIAWTHYTEINNAKKLLAEQDEYHIFINTIDAGLRYNAEPVGAPDIYHYDSASEIKLGQLFAEILTSRFLEI